MANLAFGNLVTISNEFKSFIQGGAYENLIFELLNQSKKHFPHRFEKIEHQHCGECDFIDMETGEKYDAKLPITKKQGRLIGSKNSDFEEWLKSTIEELSEFSDMFITNRGRYHVRDLTLYKIMEEEIKRNAADEHIIFFFPFLVVYEASETIWGQFASDILTCIYDELVEECVVENRKLYAIYPTVDGDLAIRNMETRVREYFSSKKLDKYISFDVSLTSK